MEYKAALLEGFTQRDSMHRKEKLQYIEDWYSGMSN